MALYLLSLVLKYHSLFKKLSLRSRIFVAMILLVLIASVLIAGVTIYQYKEQSRDYHQNRLERSDNFLNKEWYLSTKDSKYRAKDWPNYSGLKSNFNYCLS